jgi:hypothetical protein
MTYIAPHFMTDASPAEIERAISEAEITRDRYDRKASVLRGLLATRRDQIAAGTWQSQAGPAPAATAAVVSATAVTPGSAAVCRVLVTGSRDWMDEAAVWRALAEIARSLPPDQALTIVHGGCPTGADQMADDWGRDFGATIETRPADWDHCTDACPQGHRKSKQTDDVVHPGACADYCPSAGPRRNHEMVRLGADICLAFLTPASRGGAQTARLAEQAGIPTRRHTPAA